MLTMSKEIREAMKEWIRSLEHRLLFLRWKDGDGQSGELREGAVAGPSLKGEGKSEEDDSVWDLDDMKNKFAPKNCDFHNTVCPLHKLHDFQNFQKLQFWLL